MFVADQLGQFHVVKRRASRVLPQRQRECRRDSVERFLAQVSLCYQVCQAGNGTDLGHGGRQCADIRNDFEHQPGAIFIGRQFTHLAHLGLDGGEFGGWNGAGAGR